MMPIAIAETILTNDFRALSLWAVSFSEGESVEDDKVNGTRALRTLTIADGHN
jgi:hypothetical protein